MILQLVAADIELDIIIFCYKVGDRTRSGERLTQLFKRDYSDVQLTFGFPKYVDAMAES